jgi:methionyl-tRNA formyltransferase
MGTPEYAVEILKAIKNQDNHEIVGIFTQPDKPVGRKQIIQAPPVKSWAQVNLPNSPIFQPLHLKSQEITDAITLLKPDIIIVAAFGQLLPKSVLDIAPCVNLHASILPKYRGASPIQYAILEREKQTGVTAMLMDEGLDTGAMLGFSVVPIKPNDSANFIFDLLAQKAGELTLRILKLWPSIKPMSQFGALSSYASKITKKDGLISLGWDSAKILAHYNALNPWPGIYVDGGLKILEISNSPLETLEPAGTILSIEKDGAHIACARGVLFIKRVQAPSKKPLHVKDYLQGQRRGVGDLLF